MPDTKSDLEAFALRQEEAGQPAVAKRLRRIAKDIERKKSAAERTIPLFSEPVRARRESVQLGLPMAVGTAADQLSFFRDEAIAKGDAIMAKTRRSVR